MCTVLLIYVLRSYFGFSLTCHCKEYVFESSKFMLQDITGQKERQKKERGPAIELEFRIYALT